MLLVRQQEHGLELLQVLVAAPLLGELDGRAHEIAVVLLELGLEKLEEGEGVRRGAGEASEDLAVLPDAA